jgi:hypothetical protein
MMPLNDHGPLQVSMDGLLHVRRMLKNDHGLGGTKLTLLPFIIKVRAIPPLRGPHSPLGLLLSGNRVQQLGN